MHTFRVAFLVVFWCLYLCRPASGAEDVLSMTSEDAEQVQWNLTADSLTTLSGNSVVEAQGGVVLTRGNDVLKADFARYYAETHWVYLKGNVFVRMGRDDLHAEEAEFDLRSKTGWLTDGHVFIEGPHVYFSGDRIVKHWGDRYTFKNAKVTTCDGDNPAWSMQASEAVVEIDGYAQLFHSNFLVKSFDVFYSPFMILPAKKTRQSGLLMPDYGLSDKRGFYYTQPYFHVLDESRDMTFYAGYMTKIGPMLGMEYRSHPYTDEKMWFIAQGIYDKNTVKHPSENDVYSNSLLRTNRDRYWLRGMADGFIGTSGWRYRSTVDYVSDQNFLREFNQGPLGFDRSRDQLFRMFGRDLTEDDQNRISGGLLFKDWDRIGLAAGLRYEQNPALGHGNSPRSNDTLVQHLPALDVFLYKGGILPGLPLEGEARFSTGYMYRRDGTSGLRSEIHPNISLPVDLRYASLIGSLGVRQTYYSSTSFSDESPMASSGSAGSRQTGETRTVPEFKIQGYTESNRIWKLDGLSRLQVAPEHEGKSEWVALRHQIQPRISYSYISHVDQEKNPFYTDEDRLLPENELIYSITNILTRKRAVVTVSEKDGQKKADVAYDYHDIVRWRIESGYDFREAKRNRYLDYYDRRPQIDILSDLEFYLTEWASYSGKTFISPEDGELTRHDHTIAFRWNGIGEWVTGLSFRDKFYNYRYKLRYDDQDNIRLTTPVRLLQNRLNVNVTPQWHLSLLDYRNLREGGSWGRSYEQSFRITYEGQCYRILGEYNYDGYDKSYSLMVEIPGLFE